MNTEQSRVLIIGGSGLVGGALTRQLARNRVPVIATHANHPSDGTVHLDILDLKGATEALKSIRPTSVFFPASLTNVEECERHPSTARRINVEATFSLIDKALKGIPVVYYSTEYVFDGQSGPYDEDAQPNPINEYGLQKLEVEQFLAARPRSTIIRTVGVFGFEFQRKNFVYSLLRALKAKSPFRVPVDQISTPTSADQLATASINVFSSGYTGIVHLAGTERVSRFDFAKKAAKAFGVDDSYIVPVATHELDNLAKRPLEAGLISKRVPLRNLGLTVLDEALADATRTMET